MTDLITLTGPLVAFEGATPLAGVVVTATPSRKIARTSDGEDALGPDPSETTDETGAFELPLVWAAGLRYTITYRSNRVLRPYTLDCDSWPAGSTVTIADLPPIAGVPPSAVEDLQAWVLAHVAGLDVDPAVIEQAVIDYLTANPVGVPAHNDTTGRDALDAHPLASITGLVAALAGKQAAGSYATTGDLSGHASDTTGVHGIADTAALVVTTDPRLSDARTPTAHTHDDRYFTEAEVTASLAGKAATSHTHGVTDLTATGTRDATTYLRGDNTWATPAGGGGGVTDHGALTGLLDDDHTLYALADGSRGSFAASSHTHTAANISDSTATGRSLLTAADAATARTAIGAGTSSFSGAYADLSGKPTLGTAAATASTDYATAAQGAKADSALQVATAQPINAQTAAYTLVASDAGKMVEMTLAAGADLTVPSATFTAGQRVDVLDIGAGRVTFVGSGVTLNGVPSLVSSAQWSAFSIFFRSASTAVVVGRLA